ncbi:hypothetical protein SERLA73DRAFT_184383 [Serpula lacrymans var. lacrymans S7.3]|uniref:Fe2OG dioxygenase domain-containing protein n=2 Tax=Serpula lacrymans var. lacrymans TaxID=341189 RepID=F8Q347_SERL3|nr:uncharacterized protein SERLADRAFT_472053 [Serpula lacrymans var. lacrymans S7.9]EGN97608.1 hypothetical protein SERLA73DRAFT_184383 [Serpula lacrymans var. lacrymans S7.3]EGO23202.1 hypothetical protein SERLADRAFT_472053 [Serpula lacrymans var. lacrymans S7.9]
MWVFCGSTFTTIPIDTATCVEHARPHKPPPTLGAGDKIGEGDSSLVLSILPDDLADVAFENMRKEVKWNTMYHRGGEVPRLVAVEGEVDADGSFPIYRHPADESPPLSPFSPTVSRIREHVQKVLDHPVNHVLIQHYRSGADYISEHSDKTIDVVRGSKIVNVSLGAQRVMTLRMKKDGAKQLEPRDEKGARPSQRIPLPHNSMFVLGLDTNAKWLHAVNHDKRPLQTKSDEERFMNGERISLTFRHIGTFLARDESVIYGQGARGKTKGDARRVVNGTEEAAKLIAAFGKENQESEFDWESAYGQGSDVVHFTPKKEENGLYSSEMDGRLDGTCSR